MRLIAPVSIEAMLSDHGRLALWLMDDDSMRATGVREAETMAMHTKNTFQPGGEETPTPKPEPAPNPVHAVADLCEAQARLAGATLADVIVELMRRSQEREQ